MSKSEVFLGDCMDFMRELPDNYADLAVCDPPYGIGASEMTMGSGTKKKYSNKHGWDNNTPHSDYFIELMRVSKNQIIWGGNYFNLPQVRGWIFWDKGIDGDCSFADGELAWTSFDRVLRKASIRYKGFLGADTERIHITQKPIKLYDWIFANYAKPNDKILDSHLGSGSSRIAAHKAKLDFTGYEIDQEYFDKANQRFIDYASQTTLF